MAIKRELISVYLKEAFFQVEERPIYKLFLGFESMPKNKAIVDGDNETALSVVSRDYRLVTNECIHLSEGKADPSCLKTYKHASSG